MSYTNPATPDRPASHLETIDRRLNGIIEGFAGAVKILQEDNNRKLGNVPDQLKSQVDPKSPSSIGGLVGSINVALDMLESMRVTLDREVDRTRVI